MTKEADDVVRDQPPPTPTDRRAVWDVVIGWVDTVVRSKNEYTNDGTLELVLADMAERDRLGAERYGVRLTAGNGRDHLVDAYQEALDLAVYLAAYLDESGVDLTSERAVDFSPVATIGSVWLVYCMFSDTLGTVCRLRALIEEAKP